MKLRDAPFPLQLVALCAVYVVVARLGLAMDAVGGFATLVWPPTGIALAALVLGGSRLWPGVFAGALIANTWTGAPLLVALGMATGNTLEAVAGAYVVRRVAGTEHLLGRMRDVAALVVGAALLSTLVSATVGVSSLALGGVVAWARFGETWSAWWVGDVIGALVVAPLVLTWATKPLVPAPSRSGPEALAVALGIVAIGWIAFGGAPGVRPALQQPYLLFPPLMWAAIRFGPRGAASGTFLAATVAIAMTALDHGPFVRDRLSDSLMFLQVFMAVIAITFLVIAALGSEVSVRERARQKALATMRVAREQAESASAFKSTLLGVVSHELRTPLASLQLQIERLRLEGEAPPTAGPLLDRMFAQTKRLQNLIESMLTYARIESGRLATQLKEIDALAVARWCVEELRPQAESKDLSLEVVPQEGEVLLVSDPEIVHLVVANLLGNAIKFTEAGSVTIAVSATERGCRIRVTDSGPGIPEEERERIFEPFAQLRPARHKHLAGVGLGLALVRALVHALGGRVTLEPASGRGASFVVDLPGSVPLRASGSMAALGSAQRDGTSGNA